MNITTTSGLSRRLLTHEFYLRQSTKPLLLMRKLCTECTLLLTRNTTLTTLAFVRATGSRSRSCWQSSGTCSCTNAPTWKSSRTRSAPLLRQDRTRDRCVRARVHKMQLAALLTQSSAAIAHTSGAGDANGAPLLRVRVHAKPHWAGHAGPHHARSIAGG